MVEGHVRRPASDIVAAATGFALLSRVRIVGRVARLAVWRQRLLTEAARMAAPAGKRLVRARQPEARLFQMIEAHVLPPSRAVAGSAVASMATTMDVLDAVTALAASLERPRLRTRSRRGVAARTARRHVTPCQREARLGMVEGRLLPAGGRVTTTAICPESPAMCVVDSMTVTTAVANFLIALGEMTRTTRRRDVPAFQRKSRLGVIEAGLLPASLGVTGRAVFTHLTRVDVLFAMARDAIGRRLAMLVSRGVAPAARDGSVGASQRVIGR